MEEASNTVSNKENRDKEKMSHSSACSGEEDLSDVDATEKISFFKNLCTWWEGVYSLPVPRE